MSSDTIDRLLFSLSVRAHALALCEIRSGLRLSFDPMDAVTIHHVLAGTGTVRAAGCSDAAYRPGSVIVVPPGLEQSLGETGAPTEQRASDGNCGLLADGLVRFTAGDGSRDTLVVCATVTASYGGTLGLFDRLQQPLVVDGADDPALRPVFDGLACEVSAPGIGTRALLEALMKQALILLLRRQLRALGAGAPADASLFAVLRDPRLARAMAAVVEHPAHPHTVDSLAAAAGMSRSAFAAHFSRSFDRTPMQFVGQTRLRLGADLLRETDLPIKVIAASAGFNSSTYFSRAFRDAHGIDPRTFRTRAARGLADAFLFREPGLGERILGGLGQAFADGG